MTQILLFSLIIASVMVLHTCSLTKKSSNAIYDLYSGESHGTVTNLFHKSFHQCSLEDNCNFVVKNTKTNSFKKYSHAANLPKERKTYVIFKKRSVNLEKKIGKYLYIISSTILGESIKRISV